jgi:hypothetical protein
MVATRFEAQRSGPPSGRRAATRAAVIAVTAMAVGLFPPIPGYGDAAKTFDITIKNGRVVGTKSARVSKGDTVILRWTSDRRLELHLHGYDVETTVNPGAPAEMRIRARATGRFPVEVHGDADSGGGHSHGHKTIFHLEVYPD